ncbi:outer membrane protein assembly factor BamC [Thiorhodococcus mannitoliphagus]|uniref:Outer membrane protein assembly factor BamC n=2 Tax=Thiorhodococcus mannitoliphagus TaxID=329406 RepID=A0A6P1DZ07_9GAMM|nr:outer membrane protein assembly factor BamC [Thiorhodococcus mannitoliphagus]
MATAIEITMILRPRFKRLTLLATLVVLAQLMGCSSSSISDAVPDQRLVYKQQREAADNLEIPPDLTAGTYNDALDIPDGSGAPTTYSEYSGGRAQRQRVATSGDVLPEVPSVELKRRGNDRWIQADASPQAIWPKAVSFWRQQGILLVEQDPTIGLMRTDWLDNRAEIRKDFVTRMVSKVVEGAYSTSTRDQYTLRIEKGVKAGTTDIHLTQRGMTERLVTNAIGDGSRTIWEPSGTDTEKEAEMLRRLMVYLGASQQRASTAVAATGDSAAPAGPNARLVTEGGVPVLVLSEEYRSAWRRTGLALDRAGFAVEDRNQSSGVYYVRYAGRRGPEGGPPPRGEKKPGMLSRLAFWRKDDDPDKVRKYQIKVTGDGAESRVTVLDENGKPEQSANGQRILALMQQHMR